MGKHPTTVSFHLRRLEEMGLIESFKNGNQTMYELKEPMMFIDFLIRYEGKLFDSTVKPFIKLMEFYSIDPEEMNKFEKLFFEIFPHPYHV